MITSLHFPSLADGKHVLLIMLPPAGAGAAAFAEHGMIAALQAQGLPVDVVAVQLDLALYLDGDVAAVLHEAVITPALARGYAQIWLLGVSLGGMGALLYSSAYPARLAGLFLLAPFLGTRGTIAEIIQAGGLGNWSMAGSSATLLEQRILVWLQNYLGRRPASPELYLGYGQRDRFAPGHRLLAAALAPGQSAVDAGGHDWPTWLALWRQMLELRPFQASSGC